ncbi:MAG TPA: PQQ-dependent sugar dehydrogenase [Gammaproteobacteria bacterium]|nr:PQQ-dependent sugar dehydrogenase [Gammaproteobacteria bacterium]
MGGFPQRIGAAARAKQALILGVVALLGAPGIPPAAAGPALDLIRLPPGFRITVFSDRVPGARSLALGSGGTVFVGTRGEGRVYALRDRNGDGRADRVFTVARGLDMPNGVAFRGGALYVAEVNRILRLDGIESRLADPPAPVVVRDDFPQERHHGWKFIAFGPDGRLYVPVGAPCNVCDAPGHGLIYRLGADGSDKQVYARGVRNTVGFDWNPATGTLWFTDNGRDWLGDDRPPDELNRAPRPGLHFGFPYCHGASLPDPDFGPGHRCAHYTPPAAELGAHVAALGMRFYTGGNFPSAYRDRIFIAEHGSWNRSRKVGYRVVTATVHDGRVEAVQPFATGWLQGQRAWGRPVDLLVMPDGALLVSDDQAGAIYRIVYRPDPEPSGQ